MPSSTSNNAETSPHLYQNERLLCIPCRQGSGIILVMCWVAVCCSVLQCVAVCCSVLQRVLLVMCCCVLQCVAVFCIVLQWTSPRFWVSFNFAHHAPFAPVRLYTQVCMHTHTHKHRCVRSMAHVHHILTHMRTRLLEYEQVIQGGEDS